METTTDKKTLDKRTFAIGVLAVSAVVLFAANILKPYAAQADFVVKDNEFTAITASVAKGGEALYVLDNRTGGLVVLSYDPGRRSVIPMTRVTPLMNAFGAAPPPAGAAPPRNR